MTTFLPTEVYTFDGELRYGRRRLEYLVSGAEGEWGHEIVKDQPPIKVQMTEQEIAELTSRFITSRYTHEQTQATRQALADLMPFVRDDFACTSEEYGKRQVAIEAASKILEETK